MSKELTPLEALGIIAYGKEMESCDVYVCKPTQKKAFQIVEKALEILEQLQIIIGAEKIEDLPKLALETENAMYSACYELKEAENKLKALEIIKEKTLTINDLYWLKNGNYREYRKNLETLYSGVEEEHLQKILKTQEEYDLLKEVLL